MSFFKTKSKESAPEKAGSGNPYLNGREEWLERYSLSELWEKNVLGGQP